MHFARSAVCLFTLTLISGSVFAAGTGIAGKSGSVMTSGSTIRAPKANAAPGADVDPARLTPAPKTGSDRLTDSSILSAGLRALSRRMMKRKPRSRTLTATARR